MMRRRPCRCCGRGIKPSRSFAANEIIATVTGLSVVTVLYLGFFLWARHAHPEWFG